MSEGKEKKQTFFQGAPLSCICWGVFNTNTFVIAEMLLACLQPVYSHGLPRSRGDGAGARLCGAAQRYQQPPPVGDRRCCKQEGFQPQLGLREAGSVPSVCPGGEAAGVGAEMMRPNRRTFLRAVNLFKFPAVRV